eukprot:419798-Prymnesium_polylepis.1
MNDLYDDPEGARASRHSYSSCDDRAASRTEEHEQVRGRRSSSFDCGNCSRTNPSPPTALVTLEPAPDTAAPQPETAPAAEQQGIFAGVQLAQAVNMPSAANSSSFTVSHQHSDLYGVDHIGNHLCGEHEGRERQISVTACLKRASGVLKHAAEFWENSGEA